MDESKDPLLGKKAAGDVDGKDEFVGQTKFQRWNGDTVFGINGRVVRFLVLALICILTFGSYFVYDIPGSIQGSIESYYNANDFQFSLLYSVYSWPNTVQVFFGGFLIDRLFGVRLGAIIFGSLVLAGQLLFAFSAVQHSFVRGESLGVAQSAFTARWFKGKELAFAFGIALSFARVGSAANFNVTPYIVSVSGVPMALWIGVITCAFSLLGALVLSSIDKYAESRRKGMVSGVDDPPPKITDVKDFPLVLWLIFFICVTFYMAVFIMIQFGSELVQHRFGINQQDAARIVSVPYLCSAAMSPVLGFLVDRIARSVMWVVFATWLLMLAHFSFFIVPPNPAYAWPQFIIIGVAYSVCAAALWPSVALVVPSSKLGTAYGLMNAIQNFGLAVGSLAAGYLLTVTNQDYHMLTFAFGCCAGISCLLSLTLWYVDGINGSVLNASPSELRLRQQLEKIKQEQREQEASDAKK